MALYGAGVDIVQRHTSAMKQREVSDLLSDTEAWNVKLEVAA